MRLDWSWTSLAERIRRLASGEPRHSLNYVGNGYAVDTTGKPYYVESVEQRENRRRIFAQGGEGRKRTFVWNRMDGLPHVINSLTTAQCGYLLVISSHVDYDGMLVSSEDNKTPMTTGDMRKVLRLNKRKRSTFYDFLDACKSSGIISEDELGRF